MKAGIKTEMNHQVRDMSIFKKKLYTVVCVNQRTSLIAGVVS